MLFKKQTMYQQHSFQDSEGGSIIKGIKKVSGIDQLEKILNNDAKAVKEIVKKETKKTRKETRNFIKNAPEKTLKGAKNFHKEKNKKINKLKGTKSKEKKSVFDLFKTKPAQEPPKPAQGPPKPAQEQPKTAQEQPKPAQEPPKTTQGPSKEVRGGRGGRHRTQRVRRSPNRRVVRRHYVQSNNTKELNRLLKNQEEMLRALRGNFKQQILDMYDKIENEIQSIRKHFHIERDEQRRREREKRKKEEEELEREGDEL